MTDDISLGIIGGSGLYKMEGLTDIEERKVDTPFGLPSETIITGVIKEHRVAFLARHGLGHRISPSEINYQANIYALKSLGVNQIVSISAVGSLREDYAPGDIVVPDQLYDNTKNRIGSFFGQGLVAHVGPADPFCPVLSGSLFNAVKQAGASAHQGGSFITIEGPRFSTRAESNTFRSWGMSIIGMTTSPEAFLAREAEMCYAVMAHVTDYDVWHETEAPVTVDMVIKTLMNNLETAQDSLTNLVSTLQPQSETDCQCGHALANALITQRDKIAPATRSKLGLLIEKYLA